MAELIEGKTGTAKDGTRVIVRNGQIVPLDSVGTGVLANAAAPGAGFISADPSRKLSVQDTNALAKYRTAAQTAQGLRSDVSRFNTLNKTRATGPGYGIPLVGPAVKAVRSAFDPGLAEMDSISEKLTPAMREAGSGAMSDKDVGMYRAATVGVTKPGQTNANIGKAIEAGAQRQSDMASFMDEWARLKGNTVGATEAWQTYAEANPLFKEAGKGEIAVNPWTPWRQWFGLKSNSPAPAQAAKPAQRPPLSAFQR